MARIIIKTTGKREAFSVKKFKRSLRKAGAQPKVIKRITDEVLSDPTLDTTKKIYDYAYKQLKGIDRPTAARYSLKYALYDLGPEGFLFERFIAELFKTQGFRTKVGRKIHGLCVQHEIDVIIEKDKKRFMVECKFHNRPGRKTDVVVALYIKARFDDLSAQWAQEKQAPLECDGVWLITNTQFTSEATKYGTCAGVQMLGWNYPQDKGLAYLIDTLELHPITSLTCITKAQKKQLLKHNVLLCRDLLKRPDLMKQLNFKMMAQRKVEDECKALCTS